MDCSRNPSERKTLARGLAALEREEAALAAQISGDGTVCTASKPACVDVARVHRMGEGREFDA
jgi:hypothetical protein